jgi:hypothetical protein
MLRKDDVMAVVRRLVEVGEERGEPIGAPIVLLGGSAMAALELRAESLDVDLYAPSFSDEVVHQVEQELVAVYGSTFRLDVTSGENVWGTILLRDIQKAPRFSEVTTDRASYPVCALSVEDLFLLKLNAGRARDRADLPLLAARTSTARLVERFNEIQAWHGDRAALTGYADAFVATLEELHGADALALIDQLVVPEHIRIALREARG